MAYTVREMVANAERHYRKAVEFAASGMHAESAQVQALAGLLAMQLAEYAEGK
jgi:predicted component of type VI protein secretion system